MLEFVVMLVISILLALTVLVLSGAVSDEGERMVELVSFTVP